MKNKGIILALIALTVIFSSCVNEGTEMKETEKTTESNVYDSVQDTESITQADENDEASAKETTEETSKFEYQDIWERYIDKKIDSAGLSDSERARSFLFMTDNHDYEHNSKRDVGLRTYLLDYTRKKLGIKTVIHGGDVFDAFAETDDKNDDRALEVFERYVNTELYGTFGTDLLFTVGNHDGNLIGWRHAVNSSDPLYVENADPKDYFLSEDKMYSASIENLGDTVKYDEEGIRAIELTMRHFDSDVSDETISAGVGMVKMHYYRDDAENKIRYIVLDTGSNGLISCDFLGLQYSSYLFTQMKWFADVLLDLKTNYPDYNVVVSGHQLASSGANFDAAYDWIFSIYYDIISAFKTGGKCKLTTTTPWLTGTVDTDGDGVSDEFQYPVLLRYIDYLDGTLDFDYSTVKNFSETFAEYDFGPKKYQKTIFTISGHHHSDVEVYRNNYDEISNKDERPKADWALDAHDELNDRAVLAIATGTSVYSHHDSAAAEVDGGEKMTNDVPLKVRFDIVTIKDDGTVKLTRIGYGDDRAFVDYIPLK